MKRNKMARRLDGGRRGVFSAAVESSLAFSADGDFAFFRRRLAENLIALGNRHSSELVALQGPKQIGPGLRFVNG